MVINIKSQSGLATIVLVVVVGAVSLIFLKSITYLGLSDLDISQDMAKGEKALALARACVDETLMRYLYDSGYAPNSEIVYLETGQCTVSASANGNERSVEIIAEYENYYRELNLDISLGDNISINNISL
jgi:hypothetical protein